MDVCNELLAHAWLPVPLQVLRDAVSGLVVVGHCLEELGDAVKLILDGENPVIDRRAISFVGDTGKKKKDDKPADKPAGFKGPEMGPDPHGAAPTQEELEALVKQLAASASASGADSMKRR